VEAGIIYEMARPEYRALAKIALNYLTAIAGPDVARMMCFDQVRCFARHDQGDNPVRVPLQEPGSAMRLHYVSVQSLDGMVVAHVSLLMRFRYYVVLLASKYAGPPISSAHMFDIDTKRVIPALPIPADVDG
jgi:hypothetical protein